MPDREKIMSWLEGLAQQDWRMFHSDSEVQVIAEHALALLKEQEATKQISDAVRETAKQFRRTIVRCKDCVHWDKHIEECGNPDSVCFHNGWCKPDWFCADGRKR